MPTKRRVPPPLASVSRSALTAGRGSSGGGGTVETLSASSRTRPAVVPTQSASGSLADRAGASAWTALEGSPSFVSHRVQAPARSLKSPHPAVPAQTEVSPFAPRVSASDQTTPAGPGRGRERRVEAPVPVAKEPAPLRSDPEASIRGGQERPHRLGLHLPRQPHAPEDATVPDSEPVLSADPDVPARVEGEGLAGVLGKALAVGEDAEGGPRQGRRVVPINGPGEAGTEQEDDEEAPQREMDPFRKAVLSEEGVHHDGAARACATERLGQHGGGAARVVEEESLAAEPACGLVVVGRAEDGADVVLQHLHLLPRDLRPARVVADDGDDAEAVPHEGVDLDEAVAGRAVAPEEEDVLARGGRGPRRARSPRRRRACRRRPGRATRAGRAGGGRRRPWRRSRRRRRRRRSSRGAPPRSAGRG